MSLVNKSEIIDFKLVKSKKISEKERIKKTLTNTYLYDEQLINDEIDKLRSEFGLNKKEEKR